jgi:hypothetical protein
LKVLVVCLALLASLAIVFAGVDMAKDKEEKGKGSMYSPSSPLGVLGVAHLNMYNNFVTVCGDCLDGS